jgi:hypothetical protein
MQVVEKCGTMWARNTQNIARIPGSRDGGQGVYILFDGSTPVYVGKGTYGSGSGGPDAVKDAVNSGIVLAGTF